MNRFEDDNPWNPWNRSADQDDPHKPWNRSQYSTDPQAPWNKPYSTEGEYQRYCERHNIPERER